MKHRSLVMPLLICGLTAAHAHHSDAVYDYEAIVAFDAEVARYVWRNPHVTIFVETEDETGEKIEWEIESGSTPIMIRSGWSQNLLDTGEAVTIRAHPMRSGQRKAILNTLETTDGRLWSQVEGVAEVTVAASSLEGVWRGIRSTGLGGQTNRLVLTPAGETAPASYDRVTDSPNVQCVPIPPPFLNSSTNYLSGIELLQDRVILRNEFFDMSRTVYTDGREHPENGERTNQGHSIGWWEGDTLVVDTTLLSSHRAGNSSSGVPSGVQKHVVERFSLSDDGTRAIVDVFVEDPEFLEEPFEGRTEMVYSPHLQLYAYDCEP
ncbi:MAG: hypothetical protein CM1200mP36_09270 [Gammaproteobacteria bacterium]|nr:MAG: hypothetical protein CM1200mP36_09270 [Gammaproteobacteria bacterium]